jgi:hypothetical protein
MSDIIFCKNCRKPKAPFTCGICQEHTCKSCTQFIGEDTFSFLKKIPAELTHTCYCPSCFDEKVAAPLSSYEETMEKARNIIIFTKDETKKTGHIKRKEDAFTVEDCEDEQETILRLAFQAVQEGFNTLLDVHISHRKIVVGSHKKTIFSGSARPVNMDPKAVREY